MILVPCFNRTLRSVPFDHEILVLNDSSFQPNQRIGDFEGRARRQPFLTLLPVVADVFLLTDVEHHEGTAVTVEEPFEISFLIALSLDSHWQLHQ